MTNCLTHRVFPFALMLCALLVFAMTVPAAHAAENADNLIQYIPEEDWSDPALSEEEKVQKAHTVHWLTGVNPPVMPHELTERNPEAVGKFSLIQDGQGPAAHLYYAAPYSPGNGWYDMNKYISEIGSGRDSHLCFAVAMTNMIHWWMEQNQAYIERYIAALPPERAKEKETLTNYLHNNLKDGREDQAVLQHPSTSRLYNDVILPPYNGADKGGWPDKPADYFFNGYLPDKDKMARNRPTDLKTPKAPGGVFYEVFGKSILTDNIQSGRYDTLERVMGDYMDSGIGVVIGFNMMSGSHAVSLWGVEYDEQGKLCAMYLADNNDTGVDGTGTFIDGELAAMIRYKVVKSANGPAAYITTQADTSAANGKTFINSYYPLTLAREGWEAWEQTGEPLYKDGRAFLNPIPAICEEHQFENGAWGNKIGKRCTICGYEEGLILKLEMDPRNTYTGKPLKPCQIQQFNGSKLYYQNLWYENNINAGTATAYMTAKIDGITYQAKLDFTIKPRPVDAPKLMPELQSVTPYSLAVKAVSGLEYSINGEDWNAEGIFNGLEPDTDYTVSVRTAAPEDTNYTYSDPGAQTLSVRTAKADALGEPSWAVLSLTAGQVQLVNSGKQDSITLVIAGYDNHGRQTFVQTEALTGAAGELLTVSFTDSSPRHRVFLLGSGFVPVSGADPAA